MTTFLNHTTTSQRLKILLFLGALQILAYYFVGSMLTPRPFSVACPQPDTLLYCQSAKQIALGQPFVFSPGEAPSTGCTSHLYPFLLAVPYLLGLKGATLLLGGFLLNAVFYMAFLYAWHHIFESLLSDDRAKLCATVLLGLFGQSACCAFGQTDTGLIMAVTAGAFAAWLKDRRLVFGILLALSPWCRPEGMMLIAAFGFVFVCSFIRHSSLVTRHSSLVTRHSSLGSVRSSLPSRRLARASRRPDVRHHGPHDARVAAAALVHPAGAEPCRHGAGATASVGRGARD